jgi:hypothetical protein
MDIYSILASKPHSEHHLNRYIRFIEQCQQNNKKSSIKTHRHHICPRAKDMFPEYESFAKNKWNMARLTPRQHFIAHIMLWKVYPNISSQFNAVWQMKHRNNEQMNSRLYESILLEYSQRVSTRFKNLVPVYDVNGLFQRVPVSEYDESRHTPISANRVVAKTTDGDYVVVTVEEFRSRTDLHGTTKNTKAWNNGSKVVYSDIKPDSDFMIGLLQISEEEKRRRNEKTRNTISKRTPEEVERISQLASHNGKEYWNNLSSEERKKPQEFKDKLSEIRKESNPGFRATHACPTCGKEGQKANISKHHGLNGEKCRW